MHWYPKRRAGGARGVRDLPAKERLRERGIDESERIVRGAPPSDGPPADKGASNARPERSPEEKTLPASAIAAATPGPSRDGDEFHPTGTLIRELRRTSGFSVDEFAELLRVSAATVRRWETARGLLTLRSGSRAALRALRDVIAEVGA